MNHELEDDGKHPAPHHSWLQRHGPTIVNILAGGVLVVGADVVGWISWSAILPTPWPGLWPIVIAASLVAYAHVLRVRLRSTNRALAAQPVPLSWWPLAVAATLVLVVAVVVTMQLDGIAGGASADPRVRIEAIKTGLTVAAGVAGAAGLILAFRRQRSNEIIARQTAQDRDRESIQRERADKVSENDALQRRITELYIRAVELVGSKQATVRLGAFHALERLGADIPEQRGAVVSVLCGYLRMPYPRRSDPSQKSVTGVPGSDDDDEYQVRLAAQRILTHRVRRFQSTNAMAESNDASKDEELGDTPPSTFWSDMDLDLTGAHLINFDLAHCELRTARFTGARFSGSAAFNSTTFTGDARFVWFDEARFDVLARFDKCHFAVPVKFNGARFENSADFADAVFDNGVDFTGTAFIGSVNLDNVSLLGAARVDKLADYRTVEILPSNWKIEDSKHPGPAAGL